MTSKFYPSLTAILFIPSLALAGVPEGLEMLNSGDVSGAAAEFQGAYEADDGDGAFYLGRLFEMGVGTKKDETRAANLYAAGVEKGSTLAMNRLGVLYMEGTVLLRDYSESARLFCQAADAGDVNGQFNCGLAYQQGRGVEADAQKAITNWEAAGASGNVAALNLLGQLYLKGDGIEADHEKARGYFEQTAALGNAMGLYELSGYYAGLAEPDNVKAYSYANLAAVRAHPEAAKLRNDLEENMTNKEISAAQAMSKSWTEERMAASSANAQ